MTDLSAITNRLFTEAQRAVETLDRNHATAVQSISAALRTAEADRRKSMAEVRKAREEADNMIVQANRDEEDAERNWTEALDRIERGLMEIAPEPTVIVSGGLGSGTFGRGAGGSGSVGFAHRKGGE